MNKKYYKYYIVLVLILIIEIFGFNYKYWISLTNTPVKCDVYDSDGKLQNKDTTYEIIPGYSFLINNLDNDVDNIYVDLSAVVDSEWDEWQLENKQAMYFKVHITDEGHANAYCVAHDALISPFSEKSKYINIHPFGKVKSIRLEVIDNIKNDNNVGGVADNEAYRDNVYYRINSIELNHVYPFEFSFVRVLLLLLFAVSINYLFFRGYDTPFYAVKNRSAIIINLLIVSALLIGIQSQSVPDSQLQYKMLVRALANGQVSVWDNEDEILKNMDNPYDSLEREHLGANFLWDTSYYNNKYYVYFGAVPAVIYFLPYYLVTGADLPQEIYMYLQQLLFVCGSFYMIYALAKKYCKEMPIKLYMLYSTIVSLSSGVLMAKKSEIYYIPMIAGAVFSVWGIGLWVMSVLDAEKINIKKAAVGSLCMALVAGCRPQMLAASFLVIPIFWNYIKNIKKYFAGLICTFIPYIPVAGVMMAYNYARFGSVFDFGAKYNLTAYDMVHMGIHPARVLLGIWFNLFLMPSYTYEFPFLRFNRFEVGYYGYMYAEKMVGGALWLMPVLVLILFFRKALSYRHNMEECLIYIISLTGSLMIISADTIMCGVAMRYYVDYLFLLFIAAFIVMSQLLNKVLHKGEVSILNGIKTDKNAYCRMIAFLCLISIVLMMILMFCQYESGDYISSRPVYYMKLRDIFGILDI